MDLVNYIQDTFGIYQVDGKYLYYYTSVEGLKGIVESGFWVTERNFLNDKMEFTIAEDLCFEYWDKCIDDYKLRNRIKDGYKKYFDLFKLIDSEGGLYDGIYILSFSEIEDNILMWSNYTNNNGYCIAFDAKSFASNPDGKPLITGKVIYEEKNKGN